MNRPTQCSVYEITQASSYQRIIAENEYSVLIRDGYPVSEGHRVRIPKRHIGSFFEATQAEMLALLQLVDKAKSVIDREHHPDAYNIGINGGQAAVQTIPYLHIHLILRNEEDVADPRGGICWVVPEKTDYWSEQ